MPVPAALFLFAMGRTDARVHVEQDASWRSAAEHAIYPLARKITEHGEVLLSDLHCRAGNAGATPLRFKPCQVRLTTSLPTAPAKTAFNARDGRDGRWSRLEALDDATRQRKATHVEDVSRPRRLLCYAAHSAELLGRRLDHLQ